MSTPPTGIVALLHAGIAAWNAQIKAAQKETAALRPDLAVCVCAHNRSSHCSCGDCWAVCAHCECEHFEETIQ